MDLTISVLKLRKPDKALQVATCQLVSTMFVTLGKDAEDSYNTLFPVLKVLLCHSLVTSTPLEFYNVSPEK